MADLRIVDAPDLPLEEITDEVKIPTGGKGNYAVKAGDVATFVESSKDLANKTFVNNSSNGVKQQLDAHKNDKENPHNVTKDQIGLGNVNNTADLDKPVSNATQAAIITANQAKADKTYVDSQLGLKANKTYVDTQDALKANKADLGTASEYDFEDLPVSSAQKEINDKNVSTVESIADLIATKNPKSGQVFKIKSYHAGLNKGGSDLICVVSTSLVENLVTCFRSKVVGFENFYYVRTGVDVLTVEHGGAKGDKTTDDTEAFQRVVSTVNKTTNTQSGYGGLNVSCSSEQYKINGTVLIPPFVTINGNNATLYGNNRTNDCFHSAYWKNGVLTDLTLESLETAHLYRTQIKGFVLKDFNVSYNIRGFTFGCMISDTTSFNCNTHIQSVEHYFLRVERSYADQCTLGYKFSVFSGMLSFQNVSTRNCTNGFEFRAGIQATNISNISVEGTTNRAVYIEGQDNTGGITLENCYFEGNIPLMVEYYTNVREVLDIKHNYINIESGTVAKNSGNGIVNIDNTNLLYSHGVLLDSSGSTESWNNTTQKPFQTVAFGSAPNSPKGASLDKNLYKSNRPDLWEGGNHYQRIMQRDSVSGNFVALHDHYFGLIPATYYGNQGDCASNSIPFCSHTSTVTETGKLNIVITTSIAYKEFVQGAFNLHIASDTMNGVIANGRFYRDTIHFDNNTHSLVGTVSNVDGVIVIKLSGLAGAAYQCKGFIKLI